MSFPPDRRAIAGGFALASIASRAIAQPARTAPPPPSPPKPANAVAAESDLAKLPERAAAMRERILDAAKSGDIEKLRVALERNETPPVLLRGGKGDLIEQLRSKSADKEAREILARVLNVLEAPYARINPGRPQEMFVWPAFAEMMWETLTPMEWVALYRVVPASVVRESLEKRKYLGDRLGIGPDGTWHYFLTGE